MNDTRILLAMVVCNEKEKQPMIVVYQFWAADSPERDVINYYQLQLDKGINKIIYSCLFHVEFTIIVFFFYRMFITITSYTIT